MARGGMGEVFLASSGGIEGAERPCVVKLIRSEHAGDRSFLARFLDEARIQAQLQHPGVAQILDAASDEQGAPYVVVEYVEGRNLSDVHHRAQKLGVRLAWPDAVALGIVLGEALAHVHERVDPSGKPLAIVHRDLSPQNVMIGYGGDLKLIDFGTARAENRRCHTVAGIVFAKPGYVAPEVANNHPGGVPADLYAFGIMLWELVAGRRFLAGDATEHLAAVAAGTRSPSPLAQLVDAPRELDRVIARLTAPRIEDRCASAAEAVQELLRLLKVAPSLANGERGVRTRIAHLMQTLYPAEPARSRAEFARLVAAARCNRQPEVAAPPVSPAPSPAERPEPDLLPGTRYRLTRELGRGGMGVVYEAFHVDLGRTVALKVLPAEHSGAAHQERLRAEARALSRLRHENLVMLHDFGVTADGRPYYAMERLEGETLAERLEREHALDWREAARLGIQACRALEAAHAAGLVHRDLKPANLFVTRAGELKLLDFGVARSADDGAERELGDGALAFYGTPEYSAPEQLSGGEPDARSDLYALGAVLYQLVTGLLPHQASSAVALLDRKRRVDPDSPRGLAPGRRIPRSLDRAILHALERLPGLRFDSAAAFREALVAALREPEATRRRRRRSGFAAVGLIAGLLAATAVVGAGRPEVRARAAALAAPLGARLHALRGGSASEAPPAPAPAALVAEAP
ncbi:MAG: serine/threonine-protein kinase, partial [Sorangiineae bacterium]|nr:serine/threonine-protein kinase [Sorangiineae bacterium]